MPRIERLIRAVVATAKMEATLSARADLADAPRHDVEVSLPTQIPCCPGRILYGVRVHAVGRAIMLWNNCSLVTLTYEILGQSGSGLSIIGTQAALQYLIQQILLHVFDPGSRLPVEHCH